MKEIATFFLVSFLLTQQSKAQKIEIGADYGRAYFFYRHKDVGTGLRKEFSANSSFMAAFSLQKNFHSNFYWRTGLRFSLYQQYYSTRLYGGAFEESYPVILFPALLGFQTQRRLSFTANAGILLCLMPDQYDAEYGALFLLNGIIDSITRGSIKRNFTSVFPLLNINGGIRYGITPDLAVELSAGFAKGFITITDYDIYYNDGSGKNDQRARQWGKGDFANLSLGIKYSLKRKTRK